MLEEFEKSVKATLYDRLTSPLVGSLVTAWSICNYKFFLIILSNLSFAEKSVALENYFSRSNDFIRLLNWILSWFNRGEIISPTFCYYLNTYAIPVCWAVIYIFVYPWAAEKVFKKWQNYIEKKREIKNDIEKKRRLTVEEAEELYKACLKKENEITELMQNSKKELQEWKDRYNLLLEEKQQLKERLEKYEPTPAVLTDEYVEDEPEISVEAYDILKKIVDSGSVNISHFKSSRRNCLNVGNVEIPLDDRADMYIAELINERFITSTTKDHYVLQTSGVNYVKKYEKYSDLNQRVNNLENTISWGGMAALPKEAVDLLKKIVAIKENVFQVMRFDQGDFLFFGDQGKILLKSNEDVLLDELVEHSLLKALPDRKYMVTEAGYNFINNPEQQKNTYP